MYPSFLWQHNITTILLWLWLTLCVFVFFFLLFEVSVLAGEKRHIFIYNNLFHHQNHKFFFYCFILFSLNLFLAFNNYCPTGASLSINKYIFAYAYVLFQYVCVCVWVRVCVCVRACICVSVKACKFLLLFVLLTFYLPFKHISIKRTFKIQHK